MPQFDPVTHGPAPSTPHLKDKSQSTILHTLTQLQKTLTKYKIFTIHKMTNSQTDKVK